MIAPDAFVAKPLQEFDDIQIGLPYAVCSAGIVEFDKQNRVMILENLGSAGKNIKLRTFNVNFYQVGRKPGIFAVGINSIHLEFLSEVIALPFSSRDALDLGLQIFPEYLQAADLTHLSILSIFPSPYA